MNWSFDATAITLMAGMLTLLMSATVWRWLRHSNQASMVRLWSIGSGLNGAALLLTSGRGTLPDLLGYSVGGICASMAIQLHSVALRRHMGRPAAVPRFAAFWLLSTLVYLAILLTPDLRLRGLVNCVLLACGMAMLSRYAAQAAQHNGTSGPRLMAWGGVLLLVALAVRSAALASGQTEVRGIHQSWDYGLLLVCITMTALYSNLGFLGMVLELARRDESTARDAQVTEAARREAAERTADELRLLLQQRDTLAVERERLLHMLAHEIRQPLHSASGALQAAGQALLRQAPADALAVAQRLGRAQLVLGEVRSVLDNTLAAATLLSRHAPLAVQDVELDFLIALALGDLGDAQRSRVQVQWRTDQRQAELEPGLLRLALRNLLGNAFSHGGPGVSVLVQVSEQAEPPALLLHVLDDGPGVPAAATAAAGDAIRQGLGLRIVQQVMALHGGRLDLLPRAPNGLCATLVLPLPQG